MSDPTSRMLALLSLLQTRRDWPGRILAERLNVTTRTVRRDVDRLRELGYRITAVKGPDGGYALEAGSELPPLLFDDEQAVAVAIALRNATGTGVDIDEAAERALATVRQVMPSRLRHRIDGIRFTGALAGERVDPAVLEVVSAAVRDRLVLRFDYGASDRPPRRTEPHGLVTRDGRWYLVAWEIEREMWRIYRLDRMRPRQPSGPGFAPRSIPTGDATTFLDARAKGVEEEDRWPCTGTVEIALPPGQVAAWLPDAKVEPAGEHKCRATIGSWSWIGLLAQIIPFDASFAVVDPPALADAAEALAERLRKGADENGASRSRTRPGSTS